MKRAAKVSVVAQATVGMVVSNSLAMSTNTNTMRKKSKASSVQPRNAATTALTCALVQPVCTPFAMMVLPERLRRFAHSYRVAHRRFQWSADPRLQRWKQTGSTTDVPRGDYVARGALVWMPHSVLARPLHRPPRTEASFGGRAVQGMQPTEVKPRASSGWRGRSAVSKMASSSADARRFRRLQARRARRHGSAYAQISIHRTVQVRWREEPPFEYYSRHRGP